MLRDFDKGVEAEEIDVVLDIRTDGEIAFDVTGSLGDPIPFVDLAAEHRALKTEIDAAIAGVIERGDFVLGAAVEDLERRFAAFCGVAHGVGVDSGWSALELALRAFGVGPGDEVVTAANTFMATVGAIEATGARPVLVDCDPVTYNIDVAKLEAALTPRTKAVVPVHLYGRPADMDPLVEIAAQRDLFVVEDACQAHGAWYRGRRAGALGHAAAFSFYPAKNLGAFGDGGMVVTDSAEAAARIRLLRNLGSPIKYQHTIRGYNHRLDTIHAAVLAVKLGVLDDANTRRRLAAGAYRAMLADTPLVTPAESDDVTPVHHLYVVQSEDRDALRSHLDDWNIGSGIHYPVPIHLQEAFSDLGYRFGDFPVTERLADRIVSLPMHPNLSVEQIAVVAEAIRSFARHHSKVRSA